MLRIRHSLFLALGLFAATACKSGDERADQLEISEEVVASARVTAVDPALRLVTLVDDAGESLTVLCGPEVINFDRIDVGDTLRVRYRETLVAARMAPGDTMQPTETFAAGAAAPGEKPAAGIGYGLSATVRVESVDKERHLVTFTPPEGGLQTVRAVRPEGQRFLQGLKPGDMVHVTLVEALAVAVEEE